MVLFLIFFYSSSFASEDFIYQQAKESLMQQWTQQKARGPASVEEISTMGEDVKKAIHETIMGGESKDLMELRESLTEDDRRKNILDIFISPIYMVVDSKSAFWYRDYKSTSPGLQLAANLWFSPYLGFTADYRVSLGASINDDINGNSESLVTHEWFLFQFNKRKFYLDSKSHIEFSGSYRIYNMKSPLDSPNRGNISSNAYGFGFSFHKNNKGSSYSIGSELYPIIKVEEEGALTKFRSGDLEKAYGATFWYKKIFDLNRKNSIFLKLEYNIEKHNYSDFSSPIDPISNDIYNGVSVENNLMLLYLGYQWGS